MSFERLRHILFLGVELHVANHAVVLGCDSDQNHPLQIRRNLVIDDLRVSERRKAIKNLDWARIRVQGPMEYRRRSDQAESVGIDPGPKDNVLGKQIGLDFRLELQIEYLDVSPGCELRHFSFLYSHLSEQSHFQTDA